ncbi:MAG: hypothetical protein MR286_03495 [Clostridiales bacterium]|nr:hypothetical protein [Clostridiales bacterium]
MNSNQAGNVVSAKVVHDGELLQLSETAYLGKAGRNNYARLDKIDINVDSFDKNDALFAQYDISQNILRDVQETIDFANEWNNDQLEISLYAMPPEYTTVNGSEYRNTYVESRNSSFKPIDVSGINTKSHLDSAIDFSLIIAGAAIATPVVNFVTSGISLFKLYLQQTKLTTVTGDSKDWAYTSIFYDKIVKHTAIKRPAGWMEGCISQKLWLNKTSTWAHFTKSGKPDEKLDSTINKVFYTKNWSNCYTVTFNNWATGAVKDPNISMKFKGITWVFK